jgi:tetratricopeptide (TPR) repeat protein
MRERQLKTFLYHFCRNVRDDKKFCFILGAGASKQSGIPTGSELVQIWMSELEKMYPRDELKLWMEQVGISSKDLAKDYSKIYDKRFELDKKEGFAFLENLMEGKEPSCGYSVLAQILATKPHKIVITTNFDSLTEDALFIYTQKKPLVIGHEALADFIKPFGTRPIIVKIHRDLLLSPQNAGQETCEMGAAFKKNLSGVFKYFTPLVIGYGGNDGSLLGFLDSLEEIEGGIFWFYRKTDGELDPRIQKIIERFNGYAIPINSFDELMIQIGNELKLDRLDGKIKEIAEQRVKNYREQIEKVTKETGDLETKDALTSIVSRSTKDWWYYEVRASTEKDPKKRGEIYEKGIQEFPKSHELLNNYAILLHYPLKDDKKAEQLYNKAIELAPDNSFYLSNYAEFLEHTSEKKAEEFHKKAIELAPDDAIFVTRYANFLKDKDNDKAEKLYKKAIESNFAFVLGSYAIFLQDTRKDYNKAEELYKKAIEKDPQHATNIGNYAKLLIAKRDLPKAKEYIDRALELNTKGDPYYDILDLELWFYRYAVFFKENTEAENKIEGLLKQGVKSIGWYLKDVLAVAKEMGHPDYDKLCQFEKMITEDNT